MYSLMCCHRRLKDLVKNPKGVATQMKDLDAYYCLLTVERVSFFTSFSLILT